MHLEVLLVALWGLCSNADLLSFTAHCEDYPANWKYLDKRPLPTWYDEAKIGIFIHWGVFSVPSYTSEWFWMDWKGNPSPSKRNKILIDKFMTANYRPKFSYQDFAPEFTAQFLNVTEWVKLFKNAGAKYIVFTSKHHEGFTMWPSKYTFSWNSVDTGPHRDIVGELAKAVKKEPGIHFGLYHSLYEWFNPLYLADKASNFTKQDFVNNKIIPEMKELVTRYKPDILWSDGDWEAPSSYWKSEEFLAWLYNKSPVGDTVVTNDRWGSGTMCKHGGYFTCSDRYSPGTLQAHKWENAMTIDKRSWGFNRASNLNDYLTTKDLIDTLASTIACGGNMLINVGPTKDGIIIPLFQERLTDLGKWLKINGEAIYSSQPWDLCQNDTYTPNVWFTTRNQGDDVYAIVLRWPMNNTLYLACAELQTDTAITMLGVAGELIALKTDKNLTKISLPNNNKVQGNHGWVLKMTNLGTS